MGEQQDEGLLMQSAVLIIPVAQHALADQLGEAMGWGPKNYSVALSPTGSEPATHYGLHAWVEQSFVDLLSFAAQGQVPPIPGMTPEATAEVVAALAASIRPGSEGHWSEVLSVLGLTTVVTAE